jgi:hypothetical protein
MRARYAPAQPGGKPGEWSPLVLVHASGPPPDAEETLLIPEAGLDRGVLPVAAEVRLGRAAQGVTVVLFNRYWLLNLTGLPLLCRRPAAGGEPAPVLELPRGTPFGLEFPAHEECELEMRLPGYAWSPAFPVDSESAESLVVVLRSGGEAARADGRARCLPNREVRVDVSPPTPSLPY